MNTQLVTDAPAGSRRQRRRAHRPRPSTSIVLRSAGSGEASTLHALIRAHLEEGRLLPRALDELAVHADRFVVAVRRGLIVGCAELAPLSGRVAEVRSLVVDRRARFLGIGRNLVTELQRRARIAGFEQLCVFAHDAAYFARMGFSIVPHTWVPDKIARDCTTCAQFRRCGQVALVLPLVDARLKRVHTYVPLAALRG
ncbi:MAG TPA: GNAT family N-acetyltransferase [Vicinamibacterales bacterium]|nr:GNAT family N-acetyltransferase [Vicinamibacterales bacterium]